jgi:predicted aldo/keto reductase-like oxidoreductase
MFVELLKDVMKGNRERFVVSTGAYNLIIGHPNLRRSLEKRLSQFNTDYIDAFLLGGVTKEKEFPESVRDELYRFKDEGKIRSVGISTHDRKFAGKLAAEGKKVDIC